jgi:5-methylcytosine-specific restriction enzyme A
MKYNFQRGKKYKRQDVFNIIGVSKNTAGGIWFTGYNKHLDDWFIFCNVGDAGTTGHDYPNKWLGSDLLWYGKTNTTLRQPSMQDMINSLGKIYIFTRSNNRDPFTFAGCGKAKEYKDTSPVTITWELTDCA